MKKTNINRKTILKTVSLKGKGLHSGIEATLELLPAEEGNGIRLIASEETNHLINPRFIDPTKRNTTFVKGDFSVMTIEHLLSALSALEISDIQIKVNGPEVPILDGTSKMFYHAILEAGIKEFDTPQECLMFDKPLHYVDEETGADYLVLPAEELSITCCLDYPETTIGHQYAEFENSNSYLEEIAGAKTFVLLEDLEHLYDQNLIKGGSSENALIYRKEPYDKENIDSILNKLQIESDYSGSSPTLNVAPPTFKNEAARHKILDLMGDLYTLGIPVKAKIIAKRPGHAANIRFAKFLQSYYVKNKEVPIIDWDADPILNIEEIKTYLPHRYPFLLVDKIVKLTNDEVVGVKNISYNEYFFQGHFPGNPVFPGVLQMEALAQTGGILALKNAGAEGHWDTYFLKMDNVKFKQMVKPGDTLILKLQLVEPIRRGIVIMQAYAFVGSKMVSEGLLTAKIQKRNND